LVGSTSNLDTTSLRGIAGVTSMVHGVTRDQHVVVTTVAGAHNDAVAGRIHAVVDDLGIRPVNAIHGSVVHIPETATINNDVVVVFVGGIRMGTDTGCHTCEEAVPNHNRLANRIVIRTEP